ncbi:hypothetical protein NL676_010427 [Syzygium grande]|nr:hypothetical protein NL676_010427 [Syzygium grande]
MSASWVDPHDKMRSRDVNKVAKGKQAPQPAHEPGTVYRTPPPKQVDKELSKSKVQDLSLSLETFQSLM